MTDGHYVGLINSLRLYHGVWYVIKTTGVKGSEKELLESVNKSNVATITFEIETEGSKVEEPRLISLQVVDTNGSILFTEKDLRVIQSRVYKI